MNIYVLNAFTSLLKLSTCFIQIKYLYSKMLRKISVLLLISLQILIFISSSNTTHSGQSRGKSLVLLDDWHSLETHSMFWDQIRNLNIDLDFKMVDDPNIQLTYYGDYMYQSIIFFAP